MVKNYSESDVQSLVRIKTSERGWRTWRNNVGVLVDKRGIPVRYGLANDSAKVNEEFKSGDLIGIRPVVITQEMVGMTIGQFLSIECKATRWTAGSDARFLAQQRWKNLILELGGHAIITNDADAV